MMRRNITWTLLLCAAFMVGCGKQIPGDIIQPDRMENILYDYHLSISMTNNLSYSDNYQKEAYREYVFEKHHITEAEFDSSMVWYTRHTEDLAAIYKKLGERFRSEKKQVQNLLAIRENKPATSLPGDTVDVWYDRKIYWLTDAPLTNRVTFELPTDSNFKAKDAFLWSAEYVFLSEGKQKATMGFNIMFENDSVVGSVKDITRSGVQTLYIKPDSAFTVKSVNGFIYYTDQDSVNTPGVIINHISLTRYHEPVDTTAVAAKDSLAADSAKVAVDSVLTTDKKVVSVQVAEPTQDGPTRMNPRDMKENNRQQNNARPQRIKRRN
ncbi:DUF4296 domain-containing protein [Phocaeicola sp.]